MPPKKNKSKKPSKQTKKNPKNSGPSPAQSPEQTATVDESAVDETPLDEFGPNGSTDDISLENNTPEIAPTGLLTPEESPLEDRTIEEPEPEDLTLTASPDHEPEPTDSPTTPDDPTDLKPTALEDQPASDEVAVDEAQAPPPSVLNPHSPNAAEQSPALPPTLLGQEREQELETDPKPELEVQEHAEENLAAEASEAVDEREEPRPEVEEVTKEAEEEPASEVGRAIEEQEKAVPEVEEIGKGIEESPVPLAEEVEAAVDEEDGPPDESEDTPGPGAERQTPTRDGEQGQEDLTEEYWPALEDEGATPEEVAEDDWPTSASERAVQEEVTEEEDPVSSGREALQEVPEEEEPISAGEQAVEEPQSEDSGTPSESGIGEEAAATAKNGYSRSVRAASPQQGSASPNLVVASPRQREYPNPYTPPYYLTGSPQPIQYEQPQGSPRSPYQDAPQYLQSASPPPLPFQGYPHPHAQGPFFPPPGTAVPYYPMPHHTGSEVLMHRQPPPHEFGSPYHSGFPGFPGPFPGTPLRGPFQRHDSSNSRRSRQSFSQESPGTGYGDDYHHERSEFFSNSPGAREGKRKSESMPPIADDDVGDLLQRTMKTMANISAGLPDLHKMLNHYKKTNAQLKERESLLKKVEMQQSEALQHKEQHINNLTRQLESQSNKHSAESSKLRLEIGNLEEKHKEITENLELTQMAKKELEEAKAALEAEKLELERKFTEEKDTMTKAFENYKAEILAQFADEKKGMEEKFEEKRQAMEDAFEEERRALGEKFEGEKKSMIEAFEGEKSVMLEAFEEEKRSMCETSEAEKNQMKEEFDAEKKTMEENFAAEKVTMGENFEEEKKTMQGSFDDERKTTMEAFEAEKTSMQVSFAAEKTSMTEAMEEEKKKMNEAFEERRQEKEAAFENEKKEITAAFEREKELLNEDFAKQKQVMEEGFACMQKELEERMNARYKELEDEIAKEREGWAKEREELVSRWDEERTGMNNQFEEQRVAMTERHEKEKGDLQTAWSQAEAELIRKADEERGQLEREKDTLKKGWDTDKARFEEMVKELKGVTDNLGTEKSRLQKMVDKFGEWEDIKSKGDSFYLDAFRILAKEIIDLSNEHFQNLPIAPQAEILKNIPSNLPSFLGNTESSRRIRAAYVQHIVSNTLCYRVFGPFLFSLGRRYDKADSLFQAMSQELRQKSHRREAMWRQQTLYAAYTASSAKKATNATAGAVVEEIVSQIKPFADPRRKELITAAVTRIVKRAAETWRYARLEREMITARMPAAEDFAADEEGEWPAPEYEEEMFDVGNSSSIDIVPRRVILRMLPIITREPIHEVFQTNMDEPDKGCTYLSGLALYSDSPPVTARYEELNQKSSLGSKYPDTPKSPHLSSIRGFTSKRGSPDGMGSRSRSRSPPE